MTVQMGGATVNGRKPYPAATVHEFGSVTAAVQSKPKQAQVAGEGASDPGTGKKIDPKPSTPNLAPTIEVQSSGTTAEEARKKLVASFYPSTVKAAS